MNNRHLDRVISRELCRHIALELTAEQLVVVILRLDGFSNPEIARFLGVSRQAVCLRLKYAREALERAGVTP